MKIIQLFFSSAMSLCFHAAIAQTNKFKPACTDNCCKKAKPLNASSSLLKPITMNDITAKKKVVACKLTSPEMQQRKQEVLASLKKKILQKQELKEGYTYKFSGSDSLLDELVLFIKSERACCEFFTFKLSISDAESNIWLSISGPDGAKEFIKAEMGL